MRKQLLSFVCIGGLSATGLLLWHQPALAAGDVKTIDIVSPGPKFAEETVTISAGQSIKWVPKTRPGVPHHLVQVNPDDSDGPDITGPDDFTAPDTATHKFETPGVVKIRCIRHPTTMNQTITVTP
jgi:plastocyanin